MKKQIYLILKGRIGNQLFMYAFAKEIQKKLCEADTEIIIDDTDVLNLKWENSLLNYDLPNVRFVHNRKELFSPRWFIKFLILRFAERIVSFKADYMQRFSREKRLKIILEKIGIILCENGYMEFNIKNKKTYLLSGYFQSKDYFKDTGDELKKIFSLEENLIYPNLKMLCENNSVCISVKVEHNVGSSLYAVCGKEYWKEAIEYITEQIENPVFFVCSDDVEYVRNNLIDCSKYKVLFQDKNEPVYKSLAAMSRCKHFIIGNTSFGWWAQYLSKNLNKITIAPNQWMLVKMPIDLYESTWTLIDVKKYLGDKSI